MSHYVCTGGCQGISETAGQCQAADCPDFQKDLKECSCNDNQHTDVMNAKPDASVEAS